MHTKTIKQLAEGLRAGTFSSVELTQHFLTRIEKFHALNAFITVTQEHALTAAKQADKRLAEGNAPLLTGIPFAHKDIFCTHGIKTSCGSKMLDNFIAPYNATVVDKLHHAGAVMLGKLNMDEFAMGSSNENSFYGAAHNPWHENVVPGGSSGGSAAAVAAGLAVCATGTDTGGSIRQPAAFCGITGLKPSYGRVSRYGMIAYASSLDQGGPMARSAEDAAILLQAMAGFDEKDSTSINEPVPDYSRHLTESLQGLKIGLPKEFFQHGLNSQIAQDIDNALNEYRKLGATIIELSMPTLTMAIPAYYVLASAECSSNLSRYDGVRFGHRCEHPADLTDLYLRSRAEGFGSEVKRRILMGTYALSAGYYDAYYLKAQKIRRLISDDFQHALTQVDVIMSPVTPSHAFTLGEKTADPVHMYLEDLYTIAINLAGLPAMSIPIGLSADTPEAPKLPVGLQLIGAYFSEAKLLNIAHAYQQVTNWHQLIPTGFE
jgi:aspartyl-tRNA(Asn)/glutamyl-tRNA(Gln) amidotransferase subunit A